MSEKYSAEQQKAGKKLTKTHITLIAISAIIVVFVAVFSCLALSHNKIYSGISVCGIQLGETSLEEASNILQEQFSDKDPKIKINIADQSAEFNFRDFGEYDFESTAKNAYDCGRENFVSMFCTYITPFISRQLELEFYLDEEKLIELIKNQHSKLKSPYAETSYVITDDKLIITSGVSGDAIDTQQIIKAIKDSISHGEDLVIDAVITQKAYGGIDIEGIYKEIACEPENAYYDEENGKIISHKTGFDFDKVAAKELTKDAPENTSYTIQLLITYPEITEAKLSGKMFEDVLATYTTKYNTAEIDRTHNMRLAGEKVNGTVLAPGQVFSYNGIVGQRTVAKGYRNAKIFENGRVVDGLAGGICQVSTTIYNAALYSNMEIVERKNHSFPVSYAPKGQDATVVMGAIDFRFKNTMENPIKITCTISGGNCTVSILGIKEKNYKVVVNNVITGSTPFKTEYENDESLEAGKEVVKQSGSNGYTIKSTRTVYENGKVVKTESLPSSYYIPLTKIVARNETALNENEDADASADIEDVSEVPQPDNTPESDLPDNPSSEDEVEVTAPELGVETEIY